MMRGGWLVIPFAVALGCGTSPGEDAGTDASIADADVTDAGADGGGTHAAFDVVSDDGTAVLRVPENALPAGVDPSALEVRRATDVSVTSDEGITLGAAYTLLPDGLVFDEPVVLEIASRADGGLVGLLVSSAGDEGISLQEPTASDAERVLLASIPHFSTFVLVVFPGGLVSLPAPTQRRNMLTTIEGGDTAFATRLLTGTGEHFVSIEIGERTVPFLIRVDGSMPWRGRIAASSFENVMPLGDSQTAESELPIDWEPKLECTAEGFMRAEARGFYSFSFTLSRDSNRLPGVHLGRHRSTPTSFSGVCNPAMADAEDDCEDSLGPTQTCTLFEDFVDILRFSGEREELSSDEADAYFRNTAYPCNLVDDGVRTVCSDSPETFPAGAMWVFRAELAAPVPDATPTHSLIYALVLETDLDPANDWVPRDPFIWDYFQGADRWYQLNWDHERRDWSVTATQVDSSQDTAPVPTAARAVISGHVVTWYIPSSEVSRPTPSFRMSAFIHDGSFSESERGGDVTGGDPTAPLTPTTP